MIRREINSEYLNKLLAPGVRSSALDASGLTDALVRFSKEYLAGVMTLRIEGFPNGYVMLNTQVLSYLVRLLCTDAKDEPITCNVVIDDKLTIETTYPNIEDHEMTSHLIKVAKLVGFKADRRGDILIFSADITPSLSMKIYATSTDEIMDWLVLTYLM